MLLSLSCKNDNGSQSNNPGLETNETIKKLSPNRPNLNISILLDLSDRINPEKYPNPSMEFYQRDLGYIHSIAESFEWHLRNKRVITINDHIQLYIDPEPADENLNKKLSLLNMSFTRENATKEFITKTSDLYDSISSIIYNSAIIDNNYIGSDIWGFFKTNIKDFCIDDSQRNILVILTDGYLYHKNVKLKEKNETSYLTPQDIRNFKLNSSEWEAIINKNGYGFIATREDLQNLEVLVLGINPDPKNPYEQDVIFKYWSDWLNNMKVKKFEIKVANLPTNMDKTIKDFILKE